ncbi:MAG: MBL fold metallo-hydrolase [bacterium]
MIEFLPIGGADEIGANCYYLYINGTGIILDCGAHPRKTGKDALPDFSLLNNLPIDYCFISHAHQDHIGALPFLLRRFPHIKVFATPQTISIARITLNNTVNILQKQCGDDSDLKPYTHEEIELLTRAFFEIKYNELLEIEGIRNELKSKISVTFYDAGHILGSACILFEQENFRIFFTGDINLSNQTLMKKAELPEKSVDILIMESTYGSTESTKLSTWNKELNRLATYCNRILGRGGSVLIPVFALGKTQELLASLYRLMEKGILTQAEIYTGGVGREISREYDLNRFIVRRNNKNLELKEIPQQNIFEITNPDWFRKNPSIVLVSSGMVIKGTMSFKFAGYWLQQEKFAVCIVGYVDPESPGYVIANSRKGDKIELPGMIKPIEVKSDVERFYFPSHTKREGLLEIVERLSPSTTILVHGEDASQNWVGFQILSNKPNMKVYSAKQGKTILIKK